MGRQPAGAAERVVVDQSWHVRRRVEDLRTSQRRRRAGSGRVRGRRTARGPSPPRGRGDGTRGARVGRPARRPGEAARLPREVDRSPAPTPSRLIRSVGFSAHQDSCRRRKSRAPSRPSSSAPVATQTLSTGASAGGRQVRASSSSVPRPVPLSSRLGSGCRRRWPPGRPGLRAKPRRTAPGIGPCSGDGTPTAPSSPSRAADRHDGRDDQGDPDAGRQELRLRVVMGHEDHPRRGVGRGWVDEGADRFSDRTRVGHRRPRGRWTIARGPPSGGRRCTSRTPPPGVESPRAGVRRITATAVSDQDQPGPTSRRPRHGESLGGELPQPPWRGGCTAPPGVPGASPPGGGSQVVDVIAGPAGVETLRDRGGAIGPMGDIAADVTASWASESWSWTLGPDRSGVFANEGTRSTTSPRFRTGFGLDPEGGRVVHSVRR